VTGPRRAAPRAALPALLCALALSLGLAAGCSKDAPPPPTAQKSEPAPAPAPAVPPTLHAVAEHFEVGGFAYVRSLHVEGNILYVGVSTGVLVVNRKSGDVIRTFTRADGMRNNYAFVVRPGPGGTLWMGTNSGGLSTFTGAGKMVNYLPKNGLADLWVYDVAFQAPDTVWLATWDGVNRIVGDPNDKAHWTTYNVADGLANPWVYAIQIAADGTLWFGTEGGLSRLKDDRWTTWRHADGLGIPSPKGTRAPAGKSGFGAVRPGDHAATEHSHDLTTLTASGGETYNENYVFSLLLDNDGALWVGTWGAGVARFDGTRFVNYSQEDGLAGNVVYAIAQGPDGALWFGTNHGVSRYDGTHWVTYGKAEGLLGDDIYALAVDPDNMVWVGQKGGVTRLAPVHHPTLPPHPPA
jgi:ligand-binding sensor domain-containing protein